MTNRPELDASRHVDVVRYGPWGVQPPQSPQSIGPGPSPAPAPPHAPHPNRGHRRRAAALAAVVVATLFGLTRDTDRPSAGVPADAMHSVRFDVPADRPDRWCVTLTGTSTSAATEWSDLLSVYAVPKGNGRVDDLPPMLGRYERDGTTVRFVPRYAPVAGATYVARVPGLSDVRFTLPTIKEPRTTTVKAIFPTAGVVPANLLKLYVEFSAPMSDGEAEQRIHLLDARGRELPRAFLHVDAELWNESRQRLTVLFDPGRLKRGLRANLEDGAPLIEGQTFRIAIDPQWRDANGVPLASAFEKVMTIGPADRVSPDWRQWDVQPPRPHTTAPVIVALDEPLDRTLVERSLMVMDAAGNRVAGRVEVAIDDSTWSFVPSQPWRTDRYEIVVDPRLEDLAGNSLAWLFDEDLAAAGRRARRAPGPIALTFMPGEPEPAPAPTPSAAPTCTLTSAAGSGVEASGVEP